MDSTHHALFETDTLGFALMIGNVTAQELLWCARQRGITIRLADSGKLVVSANGSSLVPAVRELKPQLLALVAELERYGVADDPLILEALALFNGSLKGFVPTPRQARGARYSPASASEQQKPLAAQAVFNWAA